jgi:magnesium and cobalt transporter
MGSIPERPDAGARPGSEARAEAETEPARRGLLGRFFSGWNANETREAAAGGKDAPELLPAPAHGMSNLRKLRVDDVAVPKVDVIAVSSDIGKDALVAVFREHGFSRVPVFKGSLDHPQGLVHLKDLALQHGFGAGGRFSLKKLLRPMLYVPPSMPVGTLLQKMQRERIHMALVIDEYGGVDGLVTLEDLIETVIGEIEDEHDEEENDLWKEEKPGVYLMQSTAPLDEFEQAVGMRLRLSEEEADIDTVGGLVFLHIGRVPARGEIVALDSGFGIEIVDADPRRIKRLRLRLPGVASAEASAAEAAAAVPMPAGAKTTEPGVNG